MSRSRIDKLKQLLTRVEQRRAGPRLTAIAGANSGAAEARTPAREQPYEARTPAREQPYEVRGPAREPNKPVAPTAEPVPHLREVPPPAAHASKPLTSLEQALSQDAPSSIPPPSPPAEARARGEGEAPIPTSLPPTPGTPEPKPPSSTVPPASAEAIARAGTEVLPSVPVPARIAPSPAVPFESAVQVVSSPRIDAPKSFGELLEQSLALRPRT